MNYKDVSKEFNITMIIMIVMIIMIIVIIIMIIIIMMIIGVFYRVFEMKPLIR